MINLPTEDRFRFTNNSPVFLLVLLEGGGGIGRGAEADGE